MKIYRLNTEIYDIKPEDSSTQRVVHTGENVLNLTFRTTSPLDLRVNDFVVFDDEKYRFKKLVNPTRRSRHELEYSCRLFAPQYDLQDALYVLEDSTGVGILDDTVPLFGTASFHLQQIIRCAGAVHPEWQIGDVEEPAEGKNIVYADMDCLQALQHLAEEFNLEYWFTGTTVSLGKKKYGSPIVFRYGKGNALYELSRQNQDGRIVTRLLVKGSDRNIDSSAYGQKFLHLPDNERYVTRNVDKFGVIMGRMNFPDVYPGLIHKQPADPGSVTSVRIDENGFYFIKDAYLDFEPELLPGKNIVVDFQTGQLGGLKTDANWHSETKEFELITGDCGLGQDIPGGIFVPSTGDLYLLSDLKMPQAYIDAAERELKEKGEEAIAQLCEQKVSYKGPVNPLFFRQLGERVETGRAVIVEDDAIVDGSGSVELRIQAFTRNVNDDLGLDVEISDTIYVSRIDRIESALQEVKVDTNERINYGDACTRRRWRDAEETSDMLKNAQLNFSETINPIVVQTMQLLVGDKSLQFRFVSSRTNPQPVNCVITCNKHTKKLRCPAGILQHMTLGIDTLSSSHVPQEYRFWDMALFESNPLTESSQKYYLYAKVPKTGTAGTFILSETSIAMEGVAGQYHLLAGVLNTEFEGERSFVKLYGFTEILPGQVFTDVISDPDRNLVIDLAARKIIAEKGAEIVGKVIFSAGTSGYDNIADRPDLDGWSDDILFDAGQYSQQIAQQLANQAQSNATAASITSINSAREALAQNLGYASCGALQTAAAAGKTIISGGYIRTALIDAAAIVTSELVAQRVTALLVEAVDLRTTNLWVADGARMGNFRIKNGWIVYDGLATDGGYIAMNTAKSQILFGQKVTPAYGGPLTGMIRNMDIDSTPEIPAVALFLSAAGRESTLNRAIALDADGGIRFKGISSFVEKSRLNVNISNTAGSDASVLKYCRCFACQRAGASTYNDINLPTASAITGAFGYFQEGTGVSYDAFIRIHILVTRFSEGEYRLRASGDTPLIDSGGTARAYIGLTKGNCCELTYHNGAWYITSNNW